MTAPLRFPYYSGRPARSDRTPHPGASPSANPPTDLAGLRRTSSPSRPGARPPRLRHQHGSLSGPFALMTRATSTRELTSSFRKCCACRVSMVLTLRNRLGRDLRVGAAVGDQRSDLASRAVSVSISARPPCRGRSGGGRAGELAQLRSVSCRKAHRRRTRVAGGALSIATASSWRPAAPRARGERAREEASTRESMASQCAAASRAARRLARVARVRATAAAARAAMAREKVVPGRGRPRRPRGAARCARLTLSNASGYG